MFAYQIRLGLTLGLLMPLAAICQPEGTWLHNNSILFGLSEKATTRNISELCRSQLEIVHRAAITQEIWAMKMLDASAAPTAGFIFGQNYWFGDRRTCEVTFQSLAFKLTQPSALADELAPYPLAYRVFYVNHQSNWQFSMGVKKPQLLHIGLCVPSACSNLELEHLLETYLDESPPTVFKHFGMKTELVYSKSLELSKDIFKSKSLLWLTALVSFTVLMTAFSSLSKDRSLSGERRGKWQQFLHCFDLNDNWRQLKPRKSSQNVDLFHGLRSVTAYVILIVHIIFYLYFTVDNSLTLQETISIVATEHSYLISTVEFFFVISGFLCAMHTLNDAHLVQKIRDGNLYENVLIFLKLIMRRYLRLAPMQFSVMLVAALVHAYFRDVSIFHIYDPLDEYCAKNWWHNLLFIQNLFPLNEMCGNWTWSTACDMQFFFVSTLALFVYIKHPNFIKHLTKLALLGNLVYTFYTLNSQKDLSLNFVAIYNIMGHYYTKPHIRILSYLIGCIYGFCHINKLKPLVPLSGSSLNSFIIVSIASMILALRREPSKLAMILIFISARVLASMGLGSIILSTLNEPNPNKRGLLVRILEWRVFQYSSQFSYALYMLNPIIFLGFSYAFNDMFKINSSLLFLLFFGFSVIITCGAVVFTLFFEFPYIKLTKVIFASQQKTSTN